MDEWMDDLAPALGEEPVEPKEAGLVLKMAREVAHGVERKLAPVAAYLVGVHAGRSAARGEARVEALERATEVARSLIPTSQADAAAPEGAQPGAAPQEGPPSQGAASSPED